MTVETAGFFWKCAFCHMLASLGCLFAIDILPCLNAGDSCRAGTLAFRSFWWIPAADGLVAPFISQANRAKPVRILRNLSETGRTPFSEFDTEAVQGRLPVPDRHDPFSGSIHDSQPDHLHGSHIIRKHPVRVVALRTTQLSDSIALIV